MHLRVIIAVCCKSVYNICANKNGGTHSSSTPVYRYFPFNVFGIESRLRYRKIESRVLRLANIFAQVGLRDRSIFTSAKPPVAKGTIIHVSNCRLPAAAEPTKSQYPAKRTRPNLNCISAPADFYRSQRDDALFVSPAAAVPTISAGATADFIIARNCPAETFL